MIKKFKKGAASFYIVAFSTLILLIVAISFAAVIISEVERTSNDDLSQSAYDSALAGVEDAKLAYYNYQKCKFNTNGNDSGSNNDNNQSANCVNIVSIMDEMKKENVPTEEQCGMVWRMLGRDTNGSMVESNTANNMAQTTTCVTMLDELPNYMGSLSSSKMIDIIRPKFGEGDTVINSDYIDRIVLRWYSRDDVARSGVNFVSDYKKFPAVSIPAIAPPILSVAVLQTGLTFTMDSFNNVVDGRTNRGMVYLVPKDAGKTDTTTVEKNVLVSSNDKTGASSQNEPVAVSCDKNGEYVCSATIKLPKPVDGYRSNDTFEVIVSTPYGQPATDFMLEFWCEDGSPCAKKTSTIADGEEKEVDAPATLKGVQIEVDSTGRANDLYRRVKTRLKNKDDLALTVLGPLELLGNGKDDGMRKDLTVTKEYNFEDDDKWYSH